MPRSTPALLLSALLVFTIAAAPTAATDPPRLYVIDSGVDLPDVLHGPDYVDGTHVDCLGHGTLVSQVARATGAGPITSVRVLDCQNNAWNPHIALAMQWVWDDYRARGYQPSVVLMAITSDTGQPAWDAVIEGSTVDGLLWVVPAGNRADWTFFGSPQRVDAALVIGGTLSATEPAWFSSYGPQVDVWADATTPEWWGTSFSAARVAGRAIGVLTAFPWAPPAHTATVIRDESPDALAPERPGTTHRVWGIR